MGDTAEPPQGVRDFVLGYINSVAELEALLLMRLDDTESWSARRLAGRLYIDERAAQQVLSDLHRRGLLARADERFWYEPSSDLMQTAVDGLAESYPRFLIELTRIIHSKPRAAIREFADAFRLREDK